MNALLREISPLHQETGNMGHDRAAKTTVKKQRIEY
jgi:hypothetical protein